jgi:hypothetical protein
MLASDTVSQTIIIGQCAHHTVSAGEIELKIKTVDLKSDCVANSNPLNVSIHTLKRKGVALTMCVFLNGYGRCWKNFRLWALGLRWLLACTRK